ncbi:MAG TPA: hypothetical protein VEC56_00530 [Candidatus Krumholzibacteria bacterium]|nr:hypothetical protein [Candidatus Krumholzibacteria bacterium]
MIEVRPSGAVWSAIDGDFLRRVRTSSIAFGCVLAIPLATKFGWLAAGAWIAGGAWSIVNLAAIASVMRKVLTLEPRDRGAIVKALAIKFPVLYAIGFGLLAAGLPVMWLLAGFAWPLLVAVLKAAGRSYLRLDETADAPRQGNTRVLS